MQDKNSQMVKKILTELSVCFNVKGLRGVADYLKIPETTVYGWVRNGRIPDTGIILAKNQMIRREWLLTGKGSMLKETKGRKISAKIEPGISEKKQQLLEKRNRPTVVQDHLRQVVEWMDAYFSDHPDQSPLFYADLIKRYPSFDEFVHKQSDGNNKKKIKFKKTISSD